MKASGLARMFAIAAVALAAVGCDDSDGGGGGAFIGTWMYTSGTSTINCGGQSQTDQLTGNVQISKGVASPLISLSDGCSIALDINGATAASRPGQECSQTIQGSQATIKFTAYTFTVNGVVADESGSATIQIALPNGNVNCNYTATGRLSKIAQ